MHPTCPICASTSSPLFIAGTHRMYRCAECRTAFVSPQPTARELADFYEVYHRSDAEGGSYDSIEGRMQADFPRKVAMVRAPMGDPAHGRVLDVGCGKGYFVKACVDAGLRAEGIDVSETGIRYATETLEVPATAGLLSEKRPGLGRFAAVTLWATIEHLPDPAAVLRDIFELLEPGGRLLLDTGIGDDWLDRWLPGRVQWYDPPQHLWVFSRAGMERLIRQTAFELERFDPCFERSRLRRMARFVRNGAAAAGLRTAATVARLKMDRGGFDYTRYPLGNLMSVTARRPR